MNTLIKNKPAIITIGVIVIVVVIFLLISSSHNKQGSFINSNAPTIPISSEDAFHTDLNKVDFSAPVSTQSSKDISAAEKRAVYESLLAGYKTMTSKDVSVIRTYMINKASTPAEKNLVTKLTDTDILSLSTRLGQMMIMPTPNLFLTTSSIWTRDGSAITIQYADPNTGTTTKRVVNINGQWY